MCGIAASRLRSAIWCLPDCSAIHHIRGFCKYLKQIVHMQAQSTKLSHCLQCSALASNAALNRPDAAIAPASDARQQADRSGAEHWLALDPCPARPHSVSATVVRALPSDGNKQMRSQMNAVHGRCCNIQHRDVGPIRGKQRQEPELQIIKGLLNATPQQLEAMCTARKRWQVYSAFALAYSSKHRTRSVRSPHATACGRHRDGFVMLTAAGTG
jgi:hypothetical protein